MAKKWTAEEIGKMYLDMRSKEAKKNKRGQKVIEALYRNLKELN